MADTVLDRLLAQARARMVENWDDPKVAAVAAFDAVIMLGGQILNELREIRVQLEKRGDA